MTLVFFDQEERQPDGSGLLAQPCLHRQADQPSKVEVIVLDMIGYACRTGRSCQRYPQGLPIRLKPLPETGDFLAVLGLSDHTI